MAGILPLTNGSSEVVGEFEAKAKELYRGAEDRIFGILHLEEKCKDEA